MLSCSFIPSPIVEAVLASNTALVCAVAMPWKPAAAKAFLVVRKQIKAVIKVPRGLGGSLEELDGITLGRRG